MSKDLLDLHIGIPLRSRIFDFILPHIKVLPMFNLNMKIIYLFITSLKKLSLKYIMFTKILSS